MGDGLRTIRIATEDRSVISSAKAAVAAAGQGEAGADGTLVGWEVETIETWRQLIEAPPAPGDILVVDAWLKDGNVYEMLRRLSGRTKCRTYVLTESSNHLAGPIARFCGATGVIERPLTASKMEETFGLSGGPRPALPAEGRMGQEAASPSGAGAFLMPEALLQEIASGAQDAGSPEASRRDGEMMRALIDPITGLFNYSFLRYKLDEEFKRARRFNAPLACAMIGFESQASDDVLRELSSIFLSASRDTDVLGRFDENSFLFLLPNTGPDGAEIMAQRVANSAEERRMLDLVGDRIELAIGIGNYPSPDISVKDELYGAAREAFLEARDTGGGVVISAL